jgi:hypothetical protein
MYIIKKEIKRILNFKFYKIILIIINKIKLSLLI